MLEVHKLELQSQAALTVLDEESTLPDAATEARLMRKLDLRIVPMMTAMYLFSFMDRVNIGNARLYGLEKDLGMSGNQYQVAVSILFVTYCLFETPSNLIIKKLHPARYLAGLVGAWGLVATFTGFVQSFAGLIVCRLLLGFFEAGLFPGLMVYLTMFYNRKHIALRTAYLFSTAAFAGAIGGLLAYCIGKMDGVAGMKAWRWLFILEGIATTLLGPLALLILPNSPDTAKFLTPQDRQKLLLLRMNEVGQTTAGQEFQMSDLKDGLKDWKVYIMAAAQYCTDTMLYSFSVFLPTIIAAIGVWTPAEVQALTIPVYASGAFTYILVAFISDKTQHRGLFSAGSMPISIVGYILLISHRSPAVSFAGTFLVSIGCYTAVGLPLSWVVANQPRYAKRAYANGVQLTIGNTAGIAAPFLYATKESPFFRTGHATNIGLLALGCGIYFAMHFYYKKQNADRRAGKHDWKSQGKTEEEIAEMGERSPLFRFTV